MFFFGIFADFNSSMNRSASSRVSRLLYVRKNSFSFTS
ncbi:hypothetical protein LEP1GSC061_2522 [Leptospira wolffii serovar Khorat str. Khorat-H2]|nr:hypothetical protein LEP1GSC061_2522 [Leptospira wolffii serovar Khorat str. Khorat-H2]